MISARTIAISFSIAAELFSQAMLAATYPLPKPEDAVIGEVQVTTSAYEDTLMDIGRKFGVGYEEIVAANPGIDPWLPGEATHIVIPSRFVLPNAPRS